MTNKPRKAKSDEKQKYAPEQFLEEVQKLNYEQLGVVIECFQKAAIEENNLDFLAGASLLAEYRKQKFPKESEQAQAQATQSA